MELQSNFYLYYLDVTSTEQISNHFIEDLERLNSLK